MIQDLVKKNKQTQILEVVRNAFKDTVILT